MPFFAPERGRSISWTDSRASRPDRGRGCSRQRFDRCRQLSEPAAFMARPQGCQGLL